MMAPKHENPGWRAGASERLAVGLDASVNSNRHRALQVGATLDEKLFKLSDRLRAGAFGEWERGFALSVLGQAKRPRWRPSAKQMAVIQRLVAKPATKAADPSEALIDEADHAAA